MIPRIYYSGPLEPEANIELDAEASQHLVQVLRLQKGARLFLFDGKGYECPAQIMQTSNKRVLCTIIDKRLVSRESPLRIRLAQALLRGDRMDYVIQKATELGVSEFVPVMTTHGKVKLSANRVKTRLQHWQNIVIAACEQSGRNTLPALKQPIDLQSLAMHTKGTKWLFSPEGKYRLGDCQFQNNAVTIVIGPESGFSEDELSTLSQYDFTPVRLGPRILRTETAGTVALAAINTRWGDF